MKVRQVLMNKLYKGRETKKQVEDSTYGCIGKLVDRTPNYKTVNCKGISCMDCKEYEMEKALKMVVYNK